MKLRWCCAWNVVTTAALVSAPPNSMVTSLGIGIQADSATISTKIAAYPYFTTWVITKCSTAQERTSGPPAKVAGNVRIRSRVPGS